MEGQITLSYSSYIICFEAGAIQINLTILFAFVQEVLTRRSTTDLMYVALSRCGNPENVKVLIKHNPSGGNYILNNKNGETEFYTTNVVYKEIFGLAGNR